MSLVPGQGPKKFARIEWGGGGKRLLTHTPIFNSKSLTRGAMGTALEFPGAHLPARSSSAAMLSGLLCS